MSKKDAKVANVQACLLKFRNLLDLLPADEKTPINWSELKECKRTAENALNHLDSLFGPVPGDVMMSKCSAGDLTID
jgi:hypothetical protein